MSKERLARLKETARKGQMPTSMGNRKAETRSPGVVAAANKFYRDTNAAAKAIKGNRKKYDDYKE